MPTYFFHWTEEIVDHLQENHVSPEDFEIVMQDPFSQKTVSRSTKRPTRIGITDDGRVIFCVFEWVDQNQTQIEPITAYEID